MLKEISISLPNKPGQLAKVLEILEVVNIQAFSIEDASLTSILRLVTDDPNKAMYYLREACIDFSPSSIVAIELAHKPGQLFDVASHLATSGINIEHGYLTVELGKRRAVVLLRTDDDSRAEKILDDSNFKVCNRIEEPLSSLSAPSKKKVDFPIGDIAKIKNLIDANESGQTEFKLTLKYNPTTGEVTDRRLWTEVVRSINAFANRNGGVIFVGVRDKDRAIIGIEDDLNTFSDPREDKFRNFFSNLVTDKDIMGVEYPDLLHHYLKEVDGKRLFVIEVQASEVPVWIFKGDEFYIREGTTDKKLNSRDVDTYKKLHWHTSVRRQKT